jgi:hypothetical protein
MRAGTCQSFSVGHNPESPELRAVAALVALDPQPRLVGPATLVTNGDKTLAFTSSDLVRAEAGANLCLLPRFDGGAIPIASIGMGYSGIGLLELAQPLPADADVVPISIGTISASVETRGAPSAIVTIASGSPGWQRVVIPVAVDAVGSADDIIARLATPIEACDATFIEGAPLFTWFPPDPVLGRPPEVLAVALGYLYRQQSFKPRGVPAIAELIGLDDLGRALPYSAPEPEAQPSELAQVTGEIPDRRPKTAPPMDPLDEIRRRRS